MPGSHFFTLDDPDKYKASMLAGSFEFFLNSW